MSIEPSPAVTQPAPRPANCSYYEQLVRSSGGLAREGGRGGLPFPEFGEGDGEQVFLSVKRQHGFAVVEDDAAAESFAGDLSQPTQAVTVGRVDAGGGLHFDAPDLVAEFRKEAQLVIVSHQKRTMEAADCLYGVTMAPGGSSRVVSEKIA